MFLRRKDDDAKSDEDLVRAVRNGRQAALGVLWDRYAHLLFGVSMKYLKDQERSKDAVMELFGTLPALLAKHEVHYFRSWVHTVMRNRCLMLLRKDGRERTILEAFPSEEDHGAEEARLREADLDRLEQAITQLNAQQRTCITLFHLERMNYQQVAEATGQNIEQVRSHLQNGRRNLRIILKDHVDRNIA